MRKTRISFFTLLGALVATLAMTGVSQANHRAEVDIRYVPERPYLHGVLQSNNNACEAHRYVYVKKVRPGRNSYVGYDVSSLRGAWGLDVNAPGTYVLKVFASGGCGGDRLVVNSPGQ